MSEQYEVQRLLDGNDPVEAELREALRLASQDAPSALQLEQITEGVLGTLATGAGVGAGVSGSAFKWFALKSSWAKLAVVALTVGGAAWITGRGLLPDDASRPPAASPEQAVSELAAAPTTTPGVRPDTLARVAPAEDGVAESEGPPAAGQALPGREEALPGRESDATTDEVAAAHDDGSPWVTRSTGAARPRRGVHRRSGRRSRAVAARAASARPAASAASVSASAPTAPAVSAPEAEEDAARDDTPEAEAPRYDPAELALVGQAQRALAQKPATALALLEQHRRIYPGSGYAQERDALILDALLRLDRIAELRSQAATFLGRYPRSPHRQRVRELLRQADRSAP